MEDEAFELSVKTRMQLEMCFHYMVNKIPLPPGLQASLQDVQQLALSAFTKRNDAISRLQERGQQLCIEIARSNIERKLNKAMADVLKEGATSRINILDMEQTDRD